MRFNLQSKPLSHMDTHALIVATDSTGKLINHANLLDSSLEKTVKNAIKINNFKGEKNSSLLVSIGEHKNPLRLVLIGVGKEKELSITDFKILVAQSTKLIEQANIKQASSLLTCVSVPGCTTAEVCFHATDATTSTLYSFNQLKSKKKSINLTTITWVISNKKEERTAQISLKTAQAISTGKTTAQNLGNLPGNICTPTYMAQESKKLAKRHAKVTCKIIDATEMKKLKMGSFLSVSKGSEQPPKLIIIEYKGDSTKKRQGPIVLVGKGITFDTGGISLKPSEAMIGMKYDMCGAASVIGTIEALAELKAKQHVIGVLACAENMPSHKASKPDDVVTSMSGQTIEIGNTDAEGRLVLCDALTYSARFKPKYIIDIATLTGSCVIALGSIPSGLYSNDQELADKLLEAGKQTHDRAWQMPLWEDYQEMLNSPVADVCNIGGREAGSITAACFLARFTKKYKWAHLDVAGSAFKTGKDAAASGRPVPLLTQFILDH